MELRAHIFLIISISSLILYISVDGLNILPSITQPNSKLDEVNQLGKDQELPGLDEPKYASRPVLGLAPSPTSLWGGISEVIEEAQKKIAPAASSIVNDAEAISSSVSGQGTKAFSPVPAPFSGPGSLRPGLAPSPFTGSVPYPNPLFSPGLGPGPGPSPFSAPVPYPNPSSSSPGSDMGPSSSPFSGLAPYPIPPLSPGSGGGLAPSPSSGPSSPGSAPGPSPSGFFDHDVALAIESRIKQSQTDAQLAMDEAKKLLKEPNIASSETGMCLSKCIDKYGASLNELNRAITDLGVRDVTLLADDFGAVEVDISTCQACFTENIGEDSPLKALEEATTKAARECLNVMDYAA